MNPVCVNCKVEMSCAKSGMTVAPETAPTHVRAGDKFQCPSCGAAVVVNFGAAHRSEDRHPDLLLV